MLSLICDFAVDAEGGKCALQTHFFIFSSSTTLILDIYCWNVLDGETWIEHEHY